MSASSDVVANSENDPTSSGPAATNSHGRDDASTAVSSIAAVILLISVAPPDCECGLPSHS